VGSRRVTGAIDRLPSGRWRARWRTLDGGRVTTTWGTKGDADAWLTEQAHTTRMGVWVDPTAGQVTLTQWAREWLDERSDLRPSTRAKYELLLRLHVLPALGPSPLSHLTAARVRAWYHELAGCHPATADDAYRLLRAVISTAVADRSIPATPCQVPGAGGTRTAERPVLSVAQVGALADAMLPRFRAAVLLAAWCQLRRGEVLGLQRRDLDLVAGTLRIERAWVAPPGQRPVIGAPKSDAGRRTVAIPGHLLAGLSEHLGQFVGPSPDAGLFGTSTGTAVSPRNLSRAWDDACRAAGMSAHFHDLRHSGLTWAATTGATTAELMHRGGHASPRAALRYQHATKDRDKALADALARLATDAGNT